MRSKVISRGGDGQDGPTGQDAAPQHPAGRAFGAVLAAVSAAVLPLGAAWPATAAPGVSDWVGGAHAQARLLALGPMGGDARVRRAGIEIRLAPGFLTYWRQPGDAGLPPTIDTGASTNVATVDVAFPAPQVFDEAGAALYGYREDVTLPLSVTLADPSRPATLAVTLAYAVCADICLPGEATLRLALPETTDPAAASALAVAAAAVPRPAALDAPGPLAVTAVTPTLADGRPGFDVAVRAAAPATLFVEGPDGWFFEPGRPDAPAPGTLLFHVAAADHPAAVPPAIDLRLTLVDAAGAIDVPVHTPVAVDAPPPKP